MQSGDNWPRLDSKSPPAYEAGHHWVSPLDFDPRVQESYAFPQPLTIFDSTVRKALYTAGVRPSVDDILFMAEALEEAGVREMLLNVHYWGEATPDGPEYAAARAILARGFAFHVTISSDSLETRIARQTIDSLRAIGADALCLSLSDPREEAARLRQMDQVREVFFYAQSLGISCVLGLLDVGRRDFDFLIRMANEGIRLGAIRLNLLDSYSSLSPEAMKLFITQFKAHLTAPLPMIMHVHDDFGLGTATAIAAATAGANPDVAVNGISYRSGFAALEEVVVSLEVLYGVRTGIRLDYLPRLSQVVAERTGVPVHPLKPIVGSYAFLRDLPDWTLHIVEDGPDCFPPVGSCVAPPVVGARMRIVWGIHQANSVIRAKLEKMELSATAEQVAEIRRRIEARIESLERYPYWVTEEEAEAICLAVAG